MESQEVLKEVLKSTSAKQIAAEMGLSLSLIYKWTEHHSASTTNGTPNNPLDRIDQLLNATRSPDDPHGDPRLIQWICERAGGFFIRNPIATPKPGDLIPATNNIVQEFADMLREIAVAAADQRVTNAEAKAVRRRWERLKSVTEGFVHSAEKGDFDAIAGELLTEAAKE